MSLKPTCGSSGTFLFLAVSLIQQDESDEDGDFNSYDYERLERLSEGQNFEFQLRLSGFDIENCTACVFARVILSQVQQGQFGDIFG